jgi:hypothetical protein
MKWERDAAAVNWKDQGRSFLGGDIGSEMRRRQLCKGQREQDACQREQLI